MVSVCIYSADVIGLALGVYLITHTQHTDIPSVSFLLAICIRVSFLLAKFLIISVPYYSFIHVGV